MLFEYIYQEGRGALLVSSWQPLSGPSSLTSLFQVYVFCPQGHLYGNRPSSIGSYLSKTFSSWSRTLDCTQASSCSGAWCSSRSSSVLFSLPALQLVCLHSKATRWTWPTNPRPCTRYPPAWRTSVAESQLLLAQTLLLSSCAWCLANICATNHKQIHAAHLSMAVVGNHFLWCGRLPTAQDDSWGRSRRSWLPSCILNVSAHWSRRTPSSRIAWIPHLTKQPATASNSQKSVTGSEWDGRTSGR